jgi:hypothetical protein
MARVWQGPEHRRAPRIDVLRRVRGQVMQIDSPLVIQDLSRTGFGAVSHIDFRVGDILDFRLETDHESITVTARVVHSRAFANSPDLSFTGFEFVPGKLLGLVQESRIDLLIDAMQAREGLFAAG